MCSKEKSYTNYSDWKGWGNELRVPSWLRDYFEGEVRKIRLNKGDRILEIGFGNGEFLSWATNHGYDVSGIEILAELVKRATKAGFTVHKHDLADSDSPFPATDKYAAILAFDVLEHLSVKESITLLKNSASLVHKGGKFLLRFPNGGSPFSNLIQNGDHTHRQAITESKVKQLVCGTGWSVYCYGNAYRAINRQSKFDFLKQITFPFRDCAELCIGLIYYGKRVPLDPVSTAILIRD